MSSSGSTVNELSLLFRMKGGDLSRVGKTDTALRSLLGELVVTVLAVLIVREEQGYVSPTVVQR